MKGFLSLLYADLLKTFSYTKRYIISTSSDVLSFYAIFLVMYLGISSTASGFTTEEFNNMISGQVVGFIVFYFSSMFLTVPDHQLYNEILQGTMEQIILTPHNLITIIFSKTFSLFVRDVLAAIPLFLLLLLTTRVKITMNLSMILIFFLVLAGVFGLSLILGGLMLVFKRLGSLPFIFQILFLGIGFSTIENLPEVLSNIFLSLPFTKGVSMIKGIASTTISFSFLSMDFYFLILNTLLYLVIGIFTLWLCEKIAKNRGLLGAY
jgi:ABC-type polysaccharide/polyol phosphate export permease